MITCNRKQLLSALDTACRVAPARDSNAIFPCVRLTATPGGLEVEATDARTGHSPEVAVSLTVVAMGDLPPTCANARLLKRTLTDCTGADVRLTTAGGRNRLRVGADDGTHTIPAPPVDEWPTVGATVCSGAFVPDETRAVDGDALARALRAVLPSVSTDPTRYVLHGVCLDGFAVSTDGDRLTRSVVPECSAAGMIVPRLACALVERLATGDVTVRRSAGTVEVNCGPATVRARLIDGRFPDYRQVIPQNPPMRCVVERKPMLAALKGAVRVGENSKVLHATTLAVRGDVLHLYTRDPDAGEAHAEVATVEVGADCPTGVNAGYLLDAVEAVAEDKIVLSWADELSPIRVTGSLTVDAVIMPMCDGPCVPEAVATPVVPLPVDDGALARAVAHEPVATVVPPEVAASAPAANDPPAPRDHDAGATGQRFTLATGEVVTTTLVEFPVAPCHTVANVQTSEVRLDTVDSSVRAAHATDQPDALMILPEDLEDRWFARFQGAVVEFPATPGGWAQRTPSEVADLVPVEPWECGPEVGCPLYAPRAKRVRKSA